MALPSKCPPFLPNDLVYHNLEETHLEPRFAKWCQPREQTVGGGELTAAHLYFGSFGSSAGMFAENIRRTTDGRRTIDGARHLTSIEKNSTKMRLPRAADFN